MKRAAELFVIDELGTDSGFVDHAWQARPAGGEPESAFVSIAASTWHICVTEQRGLTRLTVGGPVTRATVTEIPADSSFLGIAFSLGTFMPAMPLAGLVDQRVTLPAASSGSVWLAGSRWEIPSAGNVDVFVDRLVRRGVVDRDPIVGEALAGRVDAVSTRTLQRRVARTTGLTRSTIRQITRAERAVEALGRGRSPADVAVLLGYADQPHLTRSLKRFVGQTPAEVAHSSRGR